MTITEQAATEQAEGGAMPPLHLDSLVIEGFRGIDLLEIPRLGRVTLLAGKNGIGKTTALEAVETFARLGDPSYLAMMLLRRDERSGLVISADTPVPDWESLFNGRNAFNGPDAPRDVPRIEIGKRDAPRLIIEKHDLSDEQMLRVMQGTLVNNVTGAPPVVPPALRITYGDMAYTAPLAPVRGEQGFLYPLKLNDKEDTVRLHTRDHSIIGCCFLSSGVLQGNATYTLWDQVLKNGNEKRVYNAVRIVDDAIEDIQVTGNMPAGGPRPIVKLTSGLGRIPLHSRGEGALRVFEIATCLVGSSKGFLLIDEASNLLHYSVQRDFWRMVLQTAHDNNVQVLATTHSADCVRGFAEAANENEDVEGVYLRLERDEEGLYTVNYPEDDLLSATLNRTETR